MLVIYFFIGLILLFGIGYLVYQSKNKQEMENKAEKVDPKKDQPV